MGSAQRKSIHRRTRQRTVSRECSNNSTNAAMYTGVTTAVPAMLVELGVPVDCRMSTSLTSTSKKSESGVNAEVCRTMKSVVSSPAVAFGESRNREKLGDDATQFIAATSQQSPTLPCGVATASTMATSGSAGPRAYNHNNHARKSTKATHKHKQTQQTNKQINKQINEQTMKINEQTNNLNRTENTHIHTRASTQL